MKRFSSLYIDLDSTTKTNKKISLLVDYFKEVPPEDAAWALFFLSGGKVSRVASGKLLRAWVAELTELPLWLVEESYERVGDLAETLSLLLDTSFPKPTSKPANLEEFVESRLLQLKQKDETEIKRLVSKTWAELSTEQRFLFNKCMTGGLRVGVSKKTVSKALSHLSGIEESELAHRLVGTFEPSASNFNNLMDPNAAFSAAAKPYPFMLASPLIEAVESLGDIEDWIVEWKWDGIRAQVLKRDSEIVVWTRGEEIATSSFPEIVEALAAIPDGTVFDGEILAWDFENQAPMSFSSLQRRLGRKKVGVKLQRDVPVVLRAYDLLEHGGEDLRQVPLRERKKRLAKVLHSSEDILVSESLNLAGWDQAEQFRETARERLVEGLMLKRANSKYEVGRKRGIWWKWKVEPLTIDAVMIYAQRGHGRRAGLFSDFTFGVWDGEVLVPVAKAYSGLTDKEMASVDSFVKKNTLERWGPVRQVKAELVFELAFDSIQESTRHKSGVALRFPRIARRRKDKLAKDADNLERVRELLFVGQQ